MNSSSRIPVADNGAGDAGMNLRGSLCPVSFPVSPADTPTVRHSCQQQTGLSPFDFYQQAGKAGRQKMYISQ